MIRTVFTRFSLGSLLLLAHPCLGASGTEGASFLNIPVGGAPAALGGAYSALAANAYAPVWNPAGLGFLDSTQLAGQHVSYLESAQYEFASIVHPLSKGKSFGLSAQYLGSGDIAATNNAGEAIDDFSSHFGAYSLAYGQALTERLSMGLTAKWINAKISDVSANAYAVDLGTLYHPRNDLDLAVVLANAGTKLKFLSNGDSLPLGVRFGGAYRPLHRLTFSAEGVYAQSGPASGHFGTEWRPVDLLALRVGYRTDSLKELSALAGFSTGVGLNLWGQEFSYAWVPYGDLGDTQYFSLVLRFGGAEEQKRNLIQYQTIRKHRSAQAVTPNDPEHDQLMQLFNAESERSAQVTTVTTTP
jgi:hypothetical protein